MNENEFGGLYKLLAKKIKSVAARIIGAIHAEAVMVFGYLIFEGILYGFEISLVNIPMNALQGAAGIVIGVVLITVFEKHNIIKKLGIQEK